MVQVCGVIGLNPKTPLSQGGPGPSCQHREPQEGWDLPSPAALRDIQQRGGVGGRAGAAPGTDQVPQSLLPSPQPASTPGHVGREWNKRRPPSPQSRPPPLPGHSSPPAAARTTRGSVRKVMPSSLRPMAAGGSGGTPAPPRPVPSRPVPPQCARCWAGAGGSAGSARSPGDAQLQPGLCSYIFITRAEFLTPRLLGGSGESPAPGQPPAPAARCPR